MVGHGDSGKWKQGKKMSEWWVGALCVGVKVKKFTETKCVTNGRA